MSLLGALSAAIKPSTYASPLNTLLSAKPASSAPARVSVASSSPPAPVQVYKPTPPPPIQQPWTVKQDSTSKLAYPLPSYGVQQNNNLNPLQGSPNKINLTSTDTRNLHSFVKPKVNIFGIPGLSVTSVPSVPYAPSLPPTSIIEDTNRRNSLLSPIKKDNRYYDTLPLYQ